MMIETFIGKVSWDIEVQENAWKIWSGAVN